jgi:predicted enzyme related to lactoylglutathione lyase
LEPNHREPGDRFRVLRGEHVNLSLQVTRTPVTARDQMHLDLYSDEVDAEVERLRGLGAELVRRVDEPDDTYVVLLDPEGNEFCVCPVAGG